MTHRRAFATIVDESFGPGAVCMARTLRAVSDLPLVCIDLGVDDESRRGLAALGAELREIEPVTADFADPKWAESMNKLALFGWDEFERIVYLDSDLVVTGPLDELFEVDGGFAACADLGIKLRPGAFNAGVLVLDPDRELQARMLNRLDSPGDRWARDKSDPDWLERHPSDQGFLNLWFRDSWVRLDQAYNVSKRLYRHHPELWAELEPRMRILHFVGHKPWWPPTDEEREQGYGPLEERWWKAYEG